MARILYVEDADDIREIAELSLALEPSLEVRTCGSGPEGISIARSWQPDLVMLDVMMPGMDGIQTFAHLKDDPATSSIPVIFVTARTQTHQVAHLMSMGAAGVIPKPFDPMSLAGQVCRHLPKGNGT